MERIVQLSPEEKFTLPESLDVVAQGKLKGENCTTHPRGKIDLGSRVFL
jgi:hypothetical protein